MKFGSQPRFQISFFVPVGRGTKGTGGFVGTAVGLFVGAFVATVAFIVGLMVGEVVTLSTNPSPVRSRIQ
jgi:uncharacterized membrane protein